jgi:predicted HAD superfamily hydrolase
MRLELTHSSSLTDMTINILTPCLHIRKIIWYIKIFIAVGHEKKKFTSVSRRIVNKLSPIKSDFVLFKFSVLMKSLTT